jgi:hypothetical protein
MRIRNRRARTLPLGRARCDQSVQRTGRDEMFELVLIILIGAVVGALAK